MALESGPPAWQGAPLLTHSTGVRFRVIEALMFFALGFLAAGLIALLIIPAVNARAERLARRRLEALFPLSITELTAEKDHLRAEFAVLQRRLERKVEEAQAGRHQDMEELGRRAVRIEGLEAELAARDGRIGVGERDLADVRTRLAELDAELAAAKQAHAAGQETLAALESAHRRTLEEFAATRGQLETATTALAETRTALAAAQTRLAQLESDHADLDGRHRASLGEVDAKRITISDLETRLATQKSRADELERSLSEARSDLSAERQRVAELAQTLVAEQSRTGTLEQRIRVLEAERDGRALDAAKAAADAMDLRGERDALLARLDERKAAFTAAEEKLAETQRRLADLEAGPAKLGSPGNEQLRAENAELRRRIEEVADDIMRVSESAHEERPRRSRSTA
jgi:chromosome segregation ATPase